MTKWLLGVVSLGASWCLTVACSDKNDGNQSACPNGSLGCFCYANKTCNDGLECIEQFNVCSFSGSGFGGSFSVGGDGNVEEGGSPGDDAAGGAPPTTNGGSGPMGGSFNLGGMTTGGTNTGTAGSTAGTGGTTPTNSFPDSPLGCALVTSCPSCCETVGVYALDPLSNDATTDYVTAFDVSETAATAEYDLSTTDDIGAIFFRFKSAQTINSLTVLGTGAGGSLEIALVRAGGKDGCIYPIVGGTLSPVPDTCWGLGAGPYAALPADQIEVRVRSLLGGRAALNVTGVQYGP